MRRLPSRVRRAIHGVRKLFRVRDEAVVVNHRMTIGDDRSR